MNRRKKWKKYKTTLWIIAAFCVVMDVVIVNVIDADNAFWLVAGIFFFALFLYASLPLCLWRLLAPIKK